MKNKEIILKCFCGTEFKTLARYCKLYCSDKCQKQEYLRRDKMKWKNNQKRREYKANRNKDLKIEVFTHYCGGTPKCQCPSGLCYETLLEFLTLDHIDNNGAEDRGSSKGKRTGGGNSTYLRLKRENYPSGFRVLCYNCNCGRAKTIDNACPHEFGNSI